MTLVYRERDRWYCYEDNQLWLGDEGRWQGVYKDSPHPQTVSSVPERQQKIKEALDRGNFKEALYCFETLIATNEREIEKAVMRLPGTDLKTSGIQLIETIKRLLDENAFLNLLTGDCALKIPNNITAIQHYRDSIGNKLDITYLVGEKGNLTQVRVPHSPVFQQKELGGRRFVNFAEQYYQNGMKFATYVANIARFRNDAAHFATCYYRLGRAYLNNSEYSNAKQVFESALWFLEKVDPKLQTNEMYDGAVKRTIKGPCLFDLGMCNFHLRDYCQALACYQQALAIYSGVDTTAFRPKNHFLGIADCMLYMGESHLKIGETRSAMENLEKCIKLSKEHGIYDNISRAQHLIALTQTRNTEPEPISPEVKKTTNLTEEAKSCPRCGGSLTLVPMFFHEPNLLHQPIKSTPMRSILFCAKCHHMERENGKTFTPMGTH
jgi:tetratricopeptide (TPR) repeat protein